jgi:hypothetical protein
MATGGREERPHQLLPGHSFLRIEQLYLILFVSILICFDSFLFPGAGSVLNMYLMGAQIPVAGSMCLPHGRFNSLTLTVWIRTICKINVLMIFPMEFACEYFSAFLHGSYALFMNLRKHFRMLLLNLRKISEISSEQMVF